MERLTREDAVMRETMAVKLISTHETCINPECAALGPRRHISPCPYEPGTGRSLAPSTFLMDLEAAQRSTRWERAVAIADEAAKRDDA
jgi:hypothetical protein